MSKILITSALPYRRGVSRCAVRRSRRDGRGRMIDIAAVGPSGLAAAMRVLRTSWSFMSALLSKQPRAVELVPSAFSLTRRRDASTGHAHCNQIRLTALPNRETLALSAACSCSRTGKTQAPASAG